MDNGESSYRRFLNGDDSAFDEIMGLLFHKLVFFIDRYVHDTHVAEDIAIDVFSEFVVHKHRYNFKVSLKTYLFMLGRSRALDWLRHCKKVSFVDLSALGDMADDGKALEELALADERRKAVSQAVAKLPKDMQAAVHLIYFEEMTYREAAKVMGKRQKQVDNLLYRAKKELRTILGKDGEQLL